MVFETTGDKNNPAILMLNGSFSTGEGLKNIAEMISDEFYVILPTYGGPFFRFPVLYRLFMRKKFRNMVHQAQHGTLDEITDRFAKNRMVQWMIHGDISPYKWFIKGLADSAPYMSDESINNESDACYTFDFPQASVREQEKYLFIWSLNEPAYKSCRKIRKHYPEADYRSPGKLGHCGFISRRSEEYAGCLRNLAKGERENMMTDILQKC